MNCLPVHFCFPPHFHIPLNVYINTIHSSNVCPVSMWNIDHISSLLFFVFLLSLRFSDTCNNVILCCNFLLQINLVKHIKQKNFTNKSKCSLNDVIFLESNYLNMHVLHEQATDYLSSDTKLSSAKHSAMAMDNLAKRYTFWLLRHYSRWVKKVAP